MVRPQVLPALLLGFPGLLTAQGFRPRTELRLTPYVSAGHWQGQGDLVGGGLAFDRSASRHVWLFTDLGVATLSSGCPAAVQVNCPKTAWHVLGGLRWSVLQRESTIRPYLALALGRQDLVTTSSVLRGEAGTDLRVHARLAARVGMNYSVSLRRNAVRLWGLVGGFGFPL